LYGSLLTFGFFKYLKITDFLTLNFFIVPFSIILQIMKRSASLILLHKCSVSTPFTLHFLDVLNLNSVGLIEDKGRAEPIFSLETSNTLSLSRANNLFFFEPLHFLLQQPNRTKKMSATTNSNTNTTYYISITGLVLRSALHAPKFYYHAIPSKIQAKSAPGNLYTETYAMNGYLMTMTIWNDKKSMLSYMRNGAHVHAMKAFNDVASSGKVYGYEASSREPIPWPDAYQILMEKGRGHGGHGGGAAKSKTSTTALSSKSSHRQHLLPSLLLVAVALLFAALKMKEHVIVDNRLG
jgi:hypothetical protein